MKHLVWWLVLAGVVLPCGTQAQAPKRLPVIAGNGIVHVLVELDGTLRGWGSGYYGALGDGGYADFAAKPRAPTGLGPVLVHYMSGSASYAIKADGTVMAWSIPSKGGKVDFVLVPTPQFKLKLIE